jgi:ABC-type proline/glycine betaine transport system permease subunit
MFAGALLVAVLAIVLDLLLGGIGRLFSRRARPKREISADTVPVPT